jgi:uncharacterized membrane protein YfcA
MSTEQLIGLIAITLFAAFVNGGLGYGFSSITVPLALLFLSSRVLNPALVLLEVVLNTHVLVVNRAALPRIWKRVLPIVFGLAPGVALGTWALAAINPAWIKLFTFIVLLPLALLQASGFRRPIRSEKSAGTAFGVGVGALYASTTISGPPLATFLNNQGLAKDEFRAALGLIRVVEASLTTVAYFQAGLITMTSVKLGFSILPGVLVGVPIGAWFIRRVPAETFRRACMSFDAAIIAFAIGSVLRELKIVTGPMAYLPFAVVLVIDGVILYRYSRKGAPTPTTPAAQDPTGE